MQSSSSDSESDLDETWKCDQKEDMEVYLAVKTGHPQRLMKVLLDLVLFEIRVIGLEFDLGWCLYYYGLLELNEYNPIELHCLNRILTYWLNHKPKMIKDMILFLTAVERPEKIELIDKLIDLGCNINHQARYNENMLSRIARKDFSTKPFLKVAELLLKRGIEVNSMNFKRLFIIVIMNHNSNLLRLILRYDPVVNSWIWSVAAYRAYEFHDFECLNVMLRFYLLRQYREEIQGKPVSTTVWSFIKSDEFWLNYYICLNDIIELRDKRIGNTRWSVHDFLFKQRRVFRRWIKNEEFLNGLERSMEECFEYSYDIAEARKEAIIRSELEESSIELFNYFLQLPDSCSEVIISYLDNDSLTNFERACRL